MGVKHWFSRSSLLVVVLAALVVACRERPQEPQTQTSPPGRDASSSHSPSNAAGRSPSSAAPPAGALEPSQPFRFPSVKQLFAVGDLHGDLAATRAVLRLVGAIDEQDRWNGKDLVLVQTGDQLDRGDDERAIIELLERLTTEAKAAGGAVHVLNGNHETMNVRGDFRYVTEGGFAAFADEPAAGKSARLSMRAPAHMRGRAHAFLPGGTFARRMAQRNMVVIVGRTVFAHGGVLPNHVEYGLGRLNEEARRWMQGTAPQPPRILDGEDSPVWTRRYSDGSLSESVCAELGQVLERLDADRMVVGHTVQKRGITSACGDRIWRIDVGMARHYGGQVAALEIVGGKVSVRRLED